MGDIGIKIRCQKCSQSTPIAESPFMLVGCKHVFCQKCFKKLKRSQKYPNFRHCSICDMGYKYVQLLEPSSYVNHKCFECEKEYPEQDMQLCKTCSHGLEFESPEDVKSRILCANCAIKNHIQKGEHETVDFGSYLVNLIQTYDELDRIRARNVFCENMKTFMNETQSIQDMKNSVDDDFDKKPSNMLENLLARIKQWWKGDSVESEESDAEVD